MARWLASLAILTCTPAFAQSVVLDEQPSGELVQMEDGIGILLYDRPQGPEAIWNGQETTSFNAVVSLGAADSQYFYGPFCSATVISARWVLTAAHCVEAAEQYESAGADTVVFFDQDTTDGISTYRWTDQLVRHPGYSGSGWIEDDIGLIHMTQGAPVNAAVVNDESPNGFIGDDLTFVGYGVESDSQNGGGYRQRAEIEFQGCLPPGVHQDYADTCTVSGSWDAQFLYSEDGQANLCQGDSGGAAFERRSDGRFELAGVNSFVVPQCNYGGNGATRVDYYLPWIEGYVGAANLLTDFDADTDTDTDTDSDTDSDVDTDVTDTGWADPERPPEDAYERKVLGLCTVAPLGVPGSAWLFLSVAFAPLLRRRRR